MPYKTNNDLPDLVKNHLPKHAQSIYRNAFNRAYDEYKDAKKRYTGESLEEVSYRRVAWAIVKAKYERSSDGNWRVKNKANITI